MSTQQKAGLNDGGPAFPHLSQAPDSYEAVQFNGMTLRDYFAAKAMAALISIEPGGEETGGMDSVDFVSRAAYVIADAMLAARGAA